MSISGIYKIVNNVNGKVYVGSSGDMVKRKRSHYCYLRAGKHPNKHLQSAWNHYGEENFSFETVLYCGKELLASEERRIIIEHKSTERENGYNITDNTIAPHAGLKHSPESIKKMSVCKMGSKNKFYGKKHSDATKEAISRAKKGVKVSEERKQVILESGFVKSGEDNVNAVLTDEQVEMIREELKEFYEKRNSYWGFDSITARKFGVHSSTIRRIRLNKTRNKRG